MPQKCVCHMNINIKPILTDISLQLIMIERNDRGLLILHFACITICVEHAFKFVFFRNYEINNLSLFFIKCSGKNIFCSDFKVTWLLNDFLFNIAL